MKKIMRWLATYAIVTSVIWISVVSLTWVTGGDFWTAGTSRWTGPGSEPVNIVLITYMAIVYGASITPLLVLMCGPYGNEGGRDAEVQEH